MDLLPVILSIAQAEGPSSVLNQIITAIMTNEHVALARIWFLDQDDNCLVCAGTARRLRCTCGPAGDGRGKPAQIGAGSTARNTGFRWIPGESWRTWRGPENRFLSRISRELTTR